MFRRIRRAAFQANSINPIQMQSLAKANQLVASGHPGQAAPFSPLLPANSKPLPILDVRQTCMPRPPTHMPTAIMSNLLWIKLAVR